MNLIYIENQSGRDLREVLREKERIQQEKDRRRERFRSPKKNRDAPSDTEEKKEKELHITPGTFSNYSCFEYII